MCSGTAREWFTGMARQPKEKRTIIKARKQPLLELLRKKKLDAEKGIPHKTRGDRGLKEKGDRPKPEGGSGALPNHD